MRLFIAICFDENMLDSLVEIQDDLVRSGVKGNYTPRKNLHMTLAFIGEYDDPEQIEEVMRNVPLRSFSVKLSGYQPFKDMFFANFEENENLRDYVKRLRKALLAEEIPFDRKKFLPHVTLVRRAECTKDKALLPEFLDSEPMRVNGISLMKSERGKHEMVYTEIGYVRAF
ncbi:MAG: RNA 2',3'-cyclic phosphodiesterase [Butyrivibrio sp.]|nr:RNA 2',3'-cyclic phosphodiesterase [Butyrivibrio sp.]MBQ8030724.1 RNA 2',3'-cyclic phosphodiesterase [Butyrivibrio sp.]MBR1640976.1 RNA 2',3'-cyclic phosphodiesterase [Butyrivibrio sp.]